MLYTSKKNVHVFLFTRRLPIGPKFTTKSGCVIAVAGGKGGKLDVGGREGELLLIPAPQKLQNLASSSISLPHLEQNMVVIMVRVDRFRS